MLNLDYENIMENITNELYCAKVKKLYPDAIIPKRGSVGSAGFDLYAHVDHDTIIHPHETVIIGTGLSIAPPTNTFGAIFARSSIATKEGLRPANCVGVCDEDYRGEYKVPIHNDSEHTAVIQNGERIAQVVFLQYGPNYEMKEVEELNETERSDGGFGSTGKF